MKKTLLRICISLYIIGAVVSYGPVAVTLRDNVEPGLAFQSRRDSAFTLAIFVAPVWPLYWSYRIASAKP